MWWRKPSVIFIILFSIITLSSKFILPHTNFISYDNFGYYMHLPAKYIYNDVALETNWYEEVNQKYNVTPTYFQIAQSVNGGKIMRFYKGMSYLWTPAFFAGDFYADVAGYPTDGFSKPYQWALIIFGGLFSILGFIFARKILKIYFNETVTTIALILVFIGTNLLYFVSIGNDTPHAYLFTLFVIFLWFTIKWHQDQKFKFAIGMGIALGFIISIRPSDIFIAVFPVLWGVYSKDTLINKFNLVRSNIIQLIIAAGIAGMFFIPQIVYYRIYGGEYFINIYNDPGAAFDFAHPRFGYVLFGFRKGWFIYSPLSLLGIFGLVVVYRKFKEYFWPAVIYLVLVIYLLASFNSLISYGWRGFIQAYATLVLPTGFFVEYILKKSLWIKSLLALIILFFITLNIFQAYQVKMNVIDGSRMTREYYFKVFFKKEATWKDQKLLRVKRSETSVDIIPDDVKFNNILLNEQKFDDINPRDTITPEPYGGTGVFELNAETIYSPVYSIPYNEITSEYYCYLRGVVFVFAYEDISEELFLVVNTRNKKKQNIKYRTMNFNNENKFVPGKWNRLVLDYISPEIYTGREQIQSYVWYTGKSRVWIDNLKLIAYTIDQKE